MPYENLTRAEILALPKEEQLAAFRANTGESFVHTDCQCPSCKRRYAWNGLLKNRTAEALKCPHCGWVGKS